MKKVIKNSIKCVIFFILSTVPAHSITILSHRVENITEKSARIIFELDEPVQAQLKYGKGASRMNQVSISMQETKEHTFYLSNLKKGEEYYYTLSIMQKNGKEFKSRIGSFITTGIPKPRVTQHIVKERTLDGGTLYFTTNTPTTHYLECGMDTAYGYTGATDKYIKQHYLTITNFLPLTKIYYRIIFTNKLGDTVAQTGDFKSGEHNIALRKKVTGTFTREHFDNYLSATPPMIERITDGTLDYFKGMATSGDPASSEQWVQVDLGQPETIDKVLTYWRATAYPKKFKLLTSADGENWKTLAENLDAGKGVSDRSQTGDPMRVLTVDGKQFLSRFIKLIVPRGSSCYQKYKNYHFVQLFELKVYPTETYGLRAPKK